MTHPYVVERSTALRWPKIELHVHLDGAFDAAVLHRSAKALLSAGKLSAEVAAKVAACGEDVSAFSTLVSSNPTDCTLKDMIDRFIFFLPFVQGNLAVVEELACAFVGRQAAQNVLYTEVRYSPHLLTAAATYEAGAGASADCTAEAQSVVDAVTRGLRRGCEQHPGTSIAQILCFIDGKPEWAESLVTLAGTQRSIADKSFGAQPLESCPVVAVDLAAGESHFAPGVADAELTANSTSHRRALCACGRLGLGVTNHAGESGPAANVTAAVSDGYGKAARIGHGYAAVAAALAAAAAGGASPTPAAVVTAFESAGLGGEVPVCFECCPTSSRCTSGWTGKRWAEHPLAQLYRLRREAEAAGDAASAAALPRVTVSSDDPAVFGASLTEECVLVAEQMGLGVQALKVLAADAVDACFLDADCKRRLHERFDQAWRECGE